MKNSLKQLILCTSCILLTVSVSYAGSQSDVLNKWGVKPGQKGGGAFDHSKKRQPMGAPYPYWIAVKFIPDFMEDKQILQYVEKEIEYARKYNKYRDQKEGRPWLSKNEVKNRHAKMAAPEFVNRYKAEIRKFVDGLSTRVVAEYKLGVPRYNKKTGRMVFQHSSRIRTDKIPQFINIAYQFTGDYGQAIQRYGKGLARMAKKTSGRAVGEIAGGAHNEKVVVNPGSRIPFALRNRGLGVARVAFNKDLMLKGIKMSRSEAEKFLNKYEKERFVARINYTVKGAFSYFDEISTFKGAGAVILVDVEDVSIYTTLHGMEFGPTRSKKVVVARYKASDLSAPKVTLATAKAKYDSGVQAQKSQAARAKQKLHQDIARLKKTCSVSKTPECYKELCNKIKKTGNQKEYKSCSKEWTQAMEDKGNRVMEANNKAWAERMAKKTEEKKTKYKKQQKIRDCQTRYSSGSTSKPWMPIKGSAAYKTAVAACINEPVRGPYGPDILGLRLGMSENDTTGLLKRQQVHGFAMLNETRPFEKANLQWTKDANHGIALFFITNGGSYSKRVAAVSRRLYVGDKKMTSDQVINGLRKKYGQELWANGSQKLLWAFPTGSAKPSPKACAGLAKLIEPRVGWNRDWAASSSGGRSSSAQRRATGSSRMNAYSECMAQVGMGAGGPVGGGSNPMGGPQGMAKAMELQRCIKEKGLMSGGKPSSTTTQTKGNSNTRLPMMIKANGSPSRYAGYKACGPVVIANINKDGKGALTDMSMVLFDPDWIAHQPAFAFKSGKGGSQIDF